MNLLLLYPDDFTKGTEVLLTDRRFDHLKKIIKPKPGQTLDVGLLNGKIGSGTINRIDNQAVTLTVAFNKNPPAPTPLTLILALPRPLMLKRILQTVTTFGVKNIHLINTQRVEKSYWNSSDLAEDVIQHQLILGLEQARDTVLPEIYFHQHFKSFIQNEAPGIIKGNQGLLAHLGNYPPCPIHQGQHIVLAVGPEGGFIGEETEQFIKSGFHPVQLGERPLRVEAAVTAFIGRMLPL